MNPRKKPFSGCRKGQAGIFIVLKVVVVLFVLGVMAYAVSRPFQDIVDDTNSDDFLSSENKAYMNDVHTAFPRWFDGMLVTMLGLGWILLLIAATNIYEHPIMFLVGILFCLAMIFITINLANSYDDVASESDLAEFRDDFPMTDYVLTHFVTVVIVLVTTTGIAVYAGAR